MSPLGWLRRRTQPAGPDGVQVRVRAHNLPEAERPDALPRLPRPLFWGLVLAVAFYVLAHVSIIQGVWPVHGTSAGAGRLLLRDAVALLVWLLVFPVLRALGFRGSWAVVALPIMIFLLTRPALFQVFTDPVYQAGSASGRAEANRLKGERAQLTTILRTYEEERLNTVFDGPPPALPSPFDVVRESARPDRSPLGRTIAYFPAILAPLALLGGFLLARRARWLRLFREKRRIPFLLTLGVFFVLTLRFTELGKVAGMTPWELLLPVFVLTWAATLANDSYNLAQPGSILAPRRVAGLVLYGALPLVPFLVIRELGLSIVLAGSMAVMLLVGTRRGWWAWLMLGIWGVLVFAAFNVDERSQTRLALAYSPYRNVTEMAPEEAQRWAARLHQFKLFDANVLAGGVTGEGAGRGHGETAPNAADDGFVTLIAAQWGVIGAFGMVMLYTLFVLQMIGVAIRERGAFERTLVVGLALLIAIPFWLAVLGGIRVIPLTGVATAFAAHGGAKLLASAVAVGIVAGISHRRAEDERLLAAGAPAGGPTDGVRIV
jgi:cell division protein FtsW (lipid II flippase)